VNRTLDSGPSDWAFTTEGSAAASSRFRVESELSPCPRSTTLADHLVESIGSEALAVHLRIDSVEQALLRQISLFPATRLTLPRSTSTIARWRGSSSRAGREFRASSCMGQTSTSTVEAGASSRGSSAPFVFADCPSHAWVALTSLQALSRFWERPSWSEPFAPIRLCESCSRQHRFA